MDKLFMISLSENSSELSSSLEVPLRRFPLGEDDPVDNDDDMVQCVGVCEQ